MPNPSRAIAACPCCCPPCPICTALLDPTTSSTDEIFSCINNHSDAFHLDCIREWCRQCRESRIAPNCPICRVSLRGTVADGLIDSVIDIESNRVVDAAADVGVPPELDLKTFGLSLLVNSGIFFFGSTLTNGESAATVSILVCWWFLICVLCLYRYLREMH